jgi:predicted DsbA family dithiol-disulfide isomerase
MSAADGIRFTPWPHPAMPGFSLPALEAAKCVAKQGEELFARVHLALYEAFLTHSRDIAQSPEVARIVAAEGADMTRFAEDIGTGFGRQAVLDDYETAVAEHGVRSIPTVIVPAIGRALVGLAEYARYRAAVAEAAG